ncbi:MAG: hypothetical protein IJJ26_12610 [Victivallales bacterium]|nr:hypothetical protein [Victivallales bacterium]
MTITKNCSITFRGYDAAGNVSPTITYKITDIRYQAPSIPVLTASTTRPTNQDVTVTAEFSANAVVKEYSFDKLTWYTYNEETGVVMTDNGVVYIRAQSANGLYSDIGKWTVSNIDRVAPAAPNASANTVNITNKDVTVSASYAYGTTVREYSRDGETWLPYETPIVMEQNGTLFFRGADEAGNYTSVTSYEVANIDKVAPDAPIVTVSNTNPTNGAVRIFATYPGDAYRKQYSSNGGENWGNFSSYIQCNQNGTWLFRSQDAAGNYSELVEVNITNIDKVAPDAPVITANTTEAAGEVILTAESEPEALLYYSTNKTNWYRTISGTVIVPKNHTVHFYAKDAAGNKSAVSSYQVTNVDSSLNPKATYNDTVIGTEENEVFDVHTAEWVKGGDGDDIYLLNAQGWNDSRITDKDGLLVFDTTCENELVLTPLSNGTARITCGEDVLNVDWRVTTQQIAYADVQSLVGMGTEELFAMLA